MEFELGSLLQDKVTGFKGTATSRVVYLNGCIQYCVTPKIGSDLTKVPEGAYFDVDQLESAGSQQIPMKKSESGGPQRDCPPS